jgi:hypothetical protein
VMSACRCGEFQREVFIGASGPPNLKRTQQNTTGARKNYKSRLVVRKIAIG